LAESSDSADRYPAAGKIANKRKADCFLEEPLKVWVPKDVFEGSDAEWASLKVGDTLRVEAEDDGDARGNWKATEAVLVVKPSEARKGGGAASQAADAAYNDAAQKVEKVLAANLKGKGWVSIGRIGGWFNSTEEVKTALVIVKQRHRQLKNFALASPLVVVKLDGGDFQISLEGEATASRTEAEKDALALESTKARAAAMGADIKTEDETPEVGGGRRRGLKGHARLRGRVSWHAPMFYLCKIVACLRRYAWAISDLAIGFL
jgi:hypothetical protein